MKYKGSLVVTIVYENFSLSREDIRKALKQNVESCINRGLLTEGLDSEVESWSSSVEFNPENHKMRAVLHVSALYEDNGESREAIRSTLSGLADYMASRGYLSTDEETVDDWSSTVEVEAAF